MNGLVVFLALVGAYALFYWLVAVRRIVPGFEPVGPLLLWKTQAGVQAMDRLARARRFWTFFGDVGIVATVAMAVLMLLLLVLQLAAFASDPVSISENAPPAITLVGLPGVNPMIPLWYGLAGLVIALVVHEGAHGVLARLGDIRVKSTGLLLCVVPIGAFVEPDEQDSERAGIRKRNRLFAAGPAANLFVAILAGALFSGVFVGAMAAPAEAGVTVTEAFPGTPAAAAGIGTGDVLVALTATFAPAPDNATADANGTANGTRETVTLADREDFTLAMNRTAAGQEVNFTVARGGEVRFVAVVLGDRAENARAQGGDPAPWDEGKGFLGVSTLDAGVLARLQAGLADPFTTPGGVGLFFLYPLFVLANRVDILNAPYSDLYTITGPLAALPEPLFFVLASLLYWVFWLNFMLGTFNALPAGPLDGGQMFRATMRDWLWRRFGVDRARVALEPGPGERGLVARGVDGETQAKIDRAHHVLRRVTMSLGFFILGLILLPILGPKVVLFFAGG